MAWHPATIVRILVPTAVLACGGGEKKVESPSTAPVVEQRQPSPPADTEEDRERKRHAEAVAIVPENSTCLPPVLRNVNAPQLQLGAVDKEARVCAVDHDRTRLLGPVACWSVDTKDGALAYKEPAPLPGRGFAAMIDDRCVRGYCLPKDAAVPADPIGLITWNLNGSKAAVLAGETVHIFDTKSKAHESSFPIRGDKGVTSDPVGLHWNGEALFIEASDGVTSPVFVFRPDGAAVGPIEALGGKQVLLSTRGGSFVLLDPDSVGISEQGMSTLTKYDVKDGKRTKLVRKLPASTCKKDELDALWQDPAAAASPKCKDFMSKTYAHLIGADVVAGSKNLLVLLRGPRLGELAVLDAKTLAEKKVIKMAWCDGGGAAAAEPAAANSLVPAAPAKADKPRNGKGAAEDPDSGGQ